VTASQKGTSLSHSRLYLFKLNPVKLSTIALISDLQRFSSGKPPTRTVRQQLFDEEVLFCAIFVME